MIEQARPCRSCDSVEERDSAGQAIDENIKWRVRFASWIPKTTNALKEFVTFPQQEWLRGRPQCFFIRAICLG